jgi:hypothetical protein
MRKHTIRVALLVAAAFLAAFVFPAAATANPFSMDWNILGYEVSPPQYFTPYIDGNNILYKTGGAGTPLWRFNIVTGKNYALPPAAGANTWGPVAAGDWVAWVEDWNIHTLNLKTGAHKHVTNEPDSDFDQDSNLSISDANGTYVVWEWGESWDTTPTAIKAKNLGSNGSVFTLASGPSRPRRPSIYGKRVVYIADWSGRGNVYLKTIGSSAAPIRLTSISGDVSLGEESLNIGSHLVVWRELVPAVGYAIHYYDFDTGQTTEIPTGITSWVYRLGVSGDRILYLSGAVDPDVRVWDTRVAKTSPTFAAIDVSTGDTAQEGTIDGSRIAYRDDRKLYFAKLMVPSISLKPVPSRISHGARIRLWGSISDQGIRIGGASIGIEKYASGKWTRIKTLTASSTGSFSYYTPKNHSKTKYRVVYDGKMAPFAPATTQHLSTVSAVKTAWPW